MSLIRRAFWPSAIALGFLVFLLAMSLGSRGGGNDPPESVLDSEGLGTYSAVMGGSTDTVQSDVEAVAETLSGVANTIEATAIADPDGFGSIATALADIDAIAKIRGSVFSIDSDASAKALNRNYNCDDADVCDATATAIDSDISEPANATATADTDNCNEICVTSASAIGTVDFTTCGATNVCTNALATATATPDNTTGAEANTAINSVNADSADTYAGDLAVSSYGDADTTHATTTTSNGSEVYDNGSYTTYDAHVYSRPQTAGLFGDNSIAMVLIATFAFGLAYAKLRTSLNVTFVGASTIPRLLLLAVALVIGVFTTTIGSAYAGDAGLVGDSDSSSWALFSAVGAVAFAVAGFATLKFGRRK